jgi:hypothetical protein
MESELMKLIYIIELSALLLMSSSLFQRQKRKNKTKKNSSGRYTTNIQTSH